MKNYSNILTKDFLIKEYIDNKKSCAQIAKQIGCSRHTIFIYLKNYKIKLRTKSEALKNKYMGKNNPSFKGDKAITRKKYYCTDCLKKGIKTEICYNTWKNGQGRCSVCSHTGDLSAYWKGGKSFEPYPIKWTKILKESIRQRDNHQCQICGKLENGRKLDVHHIDYIKENLNPDNLISLCKSCHMRSNTNRETYIEFFRILSKEKVYVNN